MAYNSRKTIPQQLTGLGFVVTLHVVVIYVLASGLGHSIIEVALPPIETKVLEEEKAAEVEPPPPPPKMEQVPPYVPPPDFQVAAEPTAAPAHTITTTATKQVVAPPPKVASEVVQPRINSRRPPSKPAYPASERRAGHEGNVILHIYVNELGKVTQAEVEKSSGFPALDDAAIKEVLRSWRLEPGTKDGKPEAMWHSISIKFSLSDK